MNNDLKKLKILVRGAGDIASGIIWSLAYAGFNVCCTEVENPSTIRTEVAFSSAIYDGTKTLGGIECVFFSDVAHTVRDDDDVVHAVREDNVTHAVSDDNVKINEKVALAVRKCWEEKKVALIIDPDAKILDEIKFDVVVDAILAKKNLGTKIDMAPLVIAVGPGFTTNVDCHIAIETMRGHNLARIIENGFPMKNTGVPGSIAGHSSDRVIHSPASGVIHNLHKIGDEVKSGEVIAVIGDVAHIVRDDDNVAHIVPGDDNVAHIVPGDDNVVHTVRDDNVAHIVHDDNVAHEVLASIDGILRGIIRDGYKVTKGLKIADIDPRLAEHDNCFTISDKARSIGGAVVVAVLHYFCN